MPAGDSWPDARNEAPCDSLTLPDANDRHVLAAAITGKVEVIVTTNLKHFPADALSVHELEAMHPDDFVGNQFDLSPQAVIASFRQQRASLRHPPMSADQFLASLDRCKLTQTAERLRSQKDLI